MGRIGKPILELDIEEIYKNLYQLSVYNNPDLMLVLVYINPDRVSNVSQFSKNLGLLTPQQIWTYILELLIRCGYSPTEIPTYNRLRIRAVINEIVYDRLLSGSVMHFAVQFGNLYALRVLMSKYPNLLNCMNNRYITPLGLAVLKDNIELVKFLLDNGADIDASPDKYQMCSNIVPKYRKYKHIILRALKNVDVSPYMIELILRHTKQELVFHDGRNVLHYIFLRKNSDVLPIVEVMAKHYNVTVDELVNNNIDKPDNLLIEPYMLAALYGIHDILDKYTTKDRVNKIWNVITELSDKTMKKLLPYIDVNRPLKNGDKLVNIYIKEGNYDMVYLLIDHGAILDDEDFYRIKDKEYRKKIVEYYYSRNQLVKEPTELWKLACDTRDQRYIDIVREGLRYLKGDAWLSTHNTYDSMCNYLYSSEFRSDIDRYRIDVLTSLHNPHNEYDLIDKPIWHYRPEHIVCFNNYCFGVQEIVKLTNITNQGYVFRNPYTNEVSVIPNDDYNRYVYMSKQDHISPIGKLLDVIHPIAITFIPKHEKIMQIYNSKTNNSLNENYIMSLANSLNLNTILEFFNKIRDYVDVIPPNTDSIIEAINSLDPELVAVAIVNQLLIIRQAAIDNNIAQEFDLIVNLITNGSI